MISKLLTVVSLICLAVGLMIGFASAGSKSTTSIFAVNSAADATDVNPGDGVCETAMGNGVCTLRAAVQETNALPGSDTVIVPAGVYTLTLVGQFEDEAAKADLDIKGNLVINGAGATSTIIDGGGITLGDRVFHVHSPSLVSVSGVTIRNGGPLSSGSGGGLFVQPNSAITLTDSIISGNRSAFGGGATNGGSLTLINSIVRDNRSTSYAGGGIGNGSGQTVTLISSVVINNVTAGISGGGIFNPSNGTVVVTNTSVISNMVTNGPGGGIYNEGTLSLYGSTVLSNTASSGGGGVYNNNKLTMNHSTIASNSTNANGGGIANDNAGVSYVSNSTLSRNVSSYRGGGILNAGGLTLINSTISGNSASADGGGMANAGSANLNNTTLTGNVADRLSDDGETGNGGGVYQDTGTFNFRNTLIAGNTDMTGEAPDCGGGMLNSQNYNLIQNTTGCAIGGTTTNNVTGQNPNLGPLQYNGGSTATHALLGGSPAIDAGDNTTCEAIDQRSWPRPYDGNGDSIAVCDMGAFEFWNITSQIYLPLILRNR